MPDVMNIRMNESRGQSEPIWISNLRVRLAGLHLECREADRVMCSILAPRLAERNRSVITSLPSTQSTWQYWTDEVDWHKAAEMERLAEPLHRQAKLMF